MSYFLIYGSAEGTKVRQFRGSDDLKDYLQQYWEDVPIKFMNFIPQDQIEIYCDDFIIIKGEVIKPKPIEIVKTYEIY